MDSEQNEEKSVKADYETHVDKCLSLILHHEEVQKMAEIIKKIYAEMSEQEEAPDAN